jgi:alpha-beta hydrolase superfamily lysophospholipase
MSDEMRFELPRLRVPTLVITGSQDTLTPLGDAEELAELIPGAQLQVLAGAAHGLMAEAPGAFNRAVLSFIAQVDAADTNATIVELPSVDLAAAEHDDQPDFRLNAQ